MPPIIIWDAGSAPKQFLDIYSDDIDWIAEVPKGVEIPLWFQRLSMYNDPFITDHPTKGNYILYFGVN